MDKYRLIEKATKYAQSKVKYIEISLDSSKSLQIISEKEEIKRIKEDINNQLSVRVTLNKATGYVQTTNPKKYKAVIDRAIKIAKNSNPDKYFKGLPSPNKPKQPKGTFDKNIDKMGPSKSIKLINDLVKYSKLNEKIKPISANFSVGSGNSYFMNSNGINIKDKGTSIGGGIEVKIKDVSANEFNQSRSLNISFREIGKKAGKLALSSINPSKAKTGNYLTIIDPRAVSSLFEMLIFHFSADKVQRNMSNLSGKEGERIASKNLTIIDNGLLEGGLFSSKTDEEGVPRQKTDLIKEGVLKEFLYDYYTASKENKKSTGNCSSISSRPSVGASNLIIESGKTNREDLISDQKESILITDLSGAGKNVVSGDFSLQIENGFLIKDGEKKPIKGNMVAGNLFNLIKNIKRVCNNKRQVGNIVAPSLIIRKLKII